MSIYSLQIICMNVCATSELILTGIRPCPSCYADLTTRRTLRMWGVMQMPNSWMKWSVPGGTSGLQLGKGPHRIHTATASPYRHSPTPETNCHHSQNKPNSQDNSIVACRIAVY